MKLGGPEEVTDAVKGAGRQVGPRSKWLGSWALKSGIADWAPFFTACKADGVDPLIIFFGFGDDITPAALQGGVKDRYTGAWKTQANLTALLASVMAKARAAGVQPIVACEVEFNKAGVEKDTAFAAYYDGLAAAVRTCPGARVAWSPGVWGDHAALHRLFGRQVAASDLVALQAVKFAPRHGVLGILGAAHELTKAFTAYPNKPHAISDACFSTYGGAYSPVPPFLGGDGRALDAQQATAITSLSGVSGLDFIVYRALRDDPAFNTANYGGAAELHVGVIRQDGSRKPGYDALLALASRVPPPFTRSEAEYQAVVLQLEACSARVLALQERVTRAQEALNGP